MHVDSHGLYIMVYICMEYDSGIDVALYEYIVPEEKSLLLASCSFYLEMKIVPVHYTVCV